MTRVQRFGHHARPTSVSLAFDTVPDFELAEN
jgi:hypothetical protein